MGKSQNSVKSDFGKQGWGVVGLCCFMLYFSSGISVDGLNATVTGLAELHGWDPAILLGFSTVSGLISIIGMFVFGLVCTKIGARWTAIISLVLGGLSYIWYGNVTSITQYVIALCLISVFCNVYGWIAGGAYLSSWFPKKKGLALGWVTMGNNIASATIVLIITGLAGALGGIQWAISAIGVVMILGAVWAWFTPNNPEDAGATPDNVPMSVEEIAAYRASSDNYVSTWTYSKLIRTKQFWVISIGLGLYMLITVGVMSQLVPRLMSLGFSLSTAVGSLTVCALVGTVGSYLWGVLDQKLSTRVATAIFGVWYAVAVILNLFSNLFCIYLSLFMLGIAIGGNANWPVSLVTTVYGHRNFSKVFSLINPAISAIRMLAFVVLAISLSLTGSYSAAYIGFVVLAFIAAFMIFKMNDQEFAEEIEEVKNTVETAEVKTVEMM